MRARASSSQPQIETATPLPGRPLRDLANHTDLLTLKHYRELYRNSATLRFANRDFARITRSRNAAKMPVSRINYDIAALKRSCRAGAKTMNKVIAQSEVDRRPQDKMVYRRLDEAIDLLAYTYKTYSLLIHGSYLSLLAPVNGHSVIGDF